MSSRSATEQSLEFPAVELRVYLLGAPEVTWAGQPLSIPRRQARALLYHLATRLQPVSREQLSFLFWPDTPESTARRNLSHLLTHLRRALPDPDVLLTATDRVGLDAYRTWSDAASFERLSAEQAVGLYRGPFLAGFSLPTSPEFDAWAAQERRHWERRYLEALVDLLEERAARGAYDDAIVYARRYLETDDLTEDVHRRLIELYAAIGDRSAALQQFERCAAILERELGVRPLPETRAVYRTVLNGQTGPLQRPAAQQPVWATLPGLDVPLLGREGAVRRLEHAYARAQTGQGAVVLISGEPGIGKSRLIQDFVTRLPGQELVLVGASQPGARALPYHPITQALRSTPALRPLSLDLQPAWLAEASRLLPELRALYPDLPLPLETEPDQARVRLFEALCQLTLALAQGSQTVVLCLDDLHWADGATLDWLAYLGHRLRNSRLLILGTYREEAADVVTELRSNLSRLGVLSELKLEGLYPDAILQLLRHLIGPVRGDDVLAGRLQQATGGNPFFLLETLRALIEAGQLSEELVASRAAPALSLPKGQRSGVDEGGTPLRSLPDYEHLELEEFPLPDTVREAVEVRLGRLSPTARQVLEAGAVLDPAFSFDLVRLTAGRRELETMDSLDELVGRQLLVEQHDGYQFQHDLIRRAVGAGLGPVRRQLLHRRAGRVLEQLEPNAVTTLARHFDAGGEVRQALHYYIRAAKRAEAVFAWREAEEHQGRILELLDQLDPDCSQPDCLLQRGQVLATRAHLYFLQGRLAERDTDLATLADLAEATGNESLHLQVLAHKVRYLNLDGRYEEAIAAAEKGLALADRLNDASARCRFLAQIGFAHYFLGQPQPALTTLESALAAAGGEADPETRGRITHVLGYVYLHLGNYARALAYQQEAHTYHQAVGDHNRMAWDLTDMGILHTRLNQLPEAEEYLTQALALARKIGSQPAESYALNNLGTLHYVRGDYQVALEYHTDSLVLQRATGSRRGEASALANSGVVYLALGDCATAESLLRQALAIQETIGYESGLAEGLAHLAPALAALGRLDEALDTARRSLAVARHIGDRYSQATALNALAQLCLDGGELEQAISLAGETVVLAQDVGLVHAHVFGLATIGLAHLALGDLEQAHRYTTQAVALLQEQGCVQGPEETVYLAYYRVLAALGRCEEAAEALCSARAEVKAKASRIPDPEQRRHYLATSSVE